MQLPGPGLERPVHWGRISTRYIVHLKPVGGGKGGLKTSLLKKTSVAFSNLEAGKAHKVITRAKNKVARWLRPYAIITLPEVSHRSGGSRIQHRNSPGRGWSGESVRNPPALSLHPHRKEDCP